MHVGIALGMLLLLGVSLFLWSRGPITSFRTWFNWFDKYDPKKSYRCMPPTLMAYYYSPPFLFGIAKALTRHGTLEHDWYMDFLMSVMRTFGYGVIDKRDNSVLVPRNLCVGLAPDADDPAEALATRDAVNVQIGRSVSVNGKTYTMSQSAVKQWPKSADDWRVLMCLPQDYGGWGCNFQDDKWTGDATVWENAPSNFLWKFYAIPHDSPLVQGFVTNASSWAKKTFFPDAMLPLLGIGQNQTYGGWYGFLQGGDRWGDYNSLMVQRYVWSSALNPTAPANSPCSSPAEYLSSGLSFGLAVAGLFWSAPEEGVAATGAIIKAATAGLAGAGVGSVLGAASQGCF